MDGPWASDLTYPTIPDWVVIDSPGREVVNDNVNPGLRAGPYAPAAYARDIFKEDIRRLGQLEAPSIIRHVDYNRQKTFSLLVII